MRNCLYKTWCCNTEHNKIIRKNNKFQMPNSYCSSFYGCWRKKFSFFGISFKIHFYTERKRLFLLLKSHWNKDVSGVNIPLRRLAFCCCGKRVCHSSLIIMENFSLVPNNLEFCAGAQIWAYWYAGIWIAQLSACFMFFFFSYQLFIFSVYESNLMRLNCVLFKKDAVKHKTSESGMTIFAYLMHKQNDWLQRLLK